MKGKLLALHLRALPRRWGVSLLLVLIALAAVTASQVLQQSIQRQQQTLVGMAQQAEIRCIVTTPQGSVNGIDLPIVTVEELTGRRVSALSAWADKVNARGQELLAEPEGLPLIHILSLDSDPALQPVNGAFVQFYKPWGEDALKGENPICLLPTSLKELAQKDENGDLMLEIKTASGASMALQVIGEINNTRVQAIYCPFFLSVDAIFSIDACSFQLPAGCDAEAARETFYQFFEEPGPDAQETGLLIQDSYYSLTWQQLSGNLRLLQLLRPVLFLFIGAIGAFGGWLATHSRRRELAVMRCLGLSRRSIFGLLLGEQTMLAMLGGALGFVLAYRINGSISGAAALYGGIILVAFLLGAAVSGLFETRVNVMELMKVEG